MNGVCFRCWGSGSEPDTSELLEVWLTKARKEYRVRALALKAASGRKKSFLAAELALLERMGKAAKARLEKFRHRGNKTRCKAIKTFPVATFQSFSSDEEYEIREASDKSHLYCSCPAWKFQKLPPNKRTCKHIKAFIETRRQHEAKVAAAKIAAAKTGQQLTLHY